MAYWKLIVWTATLIASPSIASAQSFDYRWGMSLDQAVASSRGKLQKDEAAYLYKLKGHDNWLGREWSVSINVDARVLRMESAGDNYCRTARAAIGRMPEWQARKDEAGNSVYFKATEQKQLRFELDPNMCRLSIKWADS